MDVTRIDSFICKQGFFVISCFLTDSLSSSGSLIQLPSVERGKLSKVRLGSLSLKKEGDRQCFLFTKHFLICTRSSGGKLHLLKVNLIHIFTHRHALALAIFVYTLDGSVIVSSDFLGRVRKSCSFFLNVFRI